MKVLLLSLVAALALYWLPCEVLSAEEPEWQNWEKDVTDSINIGPSLTGYKRVDLRCGADHMQVEVETDEDFDGVLYTRGSFHSQEEPCFLDARGGHNFTMRLPFNACNTRDDNELFSNTLVVQYDDELIMPGDAAFKLECDYRNPKGIEVSADLQMSRKPSLSRIILEDADPAAKDKRQTDRLTASSRTDKVTFTPKNAKKIERDEL